MDAPIKVIIDYPPPARVRCPRCWAVEGLDFRVKGEFCDAAHLAKHQKARHPGDTVSHKCSLCDYEGVTRYPLKNVRIHYESVHGDPRDAPPNSAPRASASRSQRDTAPGRAPPRNEPPSVRARAASARANVPPPGGPSNSRPPGRASTTPSPPQTRPAPTPSSAAAATRASTSYAAVTSSSAKLAVVLTRCPAATSSTRSTTSCRPPTSTRTGPVRAAATAAAAAIASAAAAETPSPANDKGGPKDLTRPPARKPSSPEAIPGCSTWLSQRRTSPTVPRLHAAPRRLVPATSSPETSPKAVFVVQTAGVMGRKRVPPPLHQFANRSTVAVTTSAAAPAATTSAAAASTSTTAAASEARTMARAMAARRAAARTSEQARPSTSSARRTDTTTTRVAANKTSPPAATATAARSTTPTNSAVRVAAKTTPPAAATTTARQSTSLAGSLPHVAATPTAPPAAATTAMRVTASQDSAPTGAAAYSTPPSAAAAITPRSPAITEPAEASTAPPLAEAAMTPRTDATLVAAKSSPATLGTATMTTSVCGSPVMATGEPSPVAATRMTPPPPALSTITGSPIAPIAAAIAAAGRRLAEEHQRALDDEEDRRWEEMLRRARELATPEAQPRIPEEPTTISSESDGELPRDDDQWRIVRRRNARRRLRSESLASPPSSPPLTPDAVPDETLNETQRPPEPTATSPSGDVPTSPAEDVSRRCADPPRRSHESPQQPARGESESDADQPPPPPTATPDTPPTTPAIIVRNSSQFNRTPRRPPPRPRRDAARRDEPPRAHAAPRAAARRARRWTVAERDELVQLAAAVATPVDLENLAASAAAFLRGSEAVEAEEEDHRNRNRNSTRHTREGGRRGAHARGDAREEAPAPTNAERRNNHRNARTREAARIQALFRRNRRRAVREVLQGPTDLCQVPRRAVQEHFERIYSGDGRPDALPAAEPANEVAREDVELLMAPFTEREVCRRLGRMTNTAPGPDGMTYNDLRAADPGARLLTALFNACLRVEKVPQAWKASNTVLAYKKGDRENLNNWRPIALGDTTPKLFAAIIADRMTDWAIREGKLSPAQKGFLRDEGCHEHNFVLQEILTDARRTRRQAVVAWLDLSNAFGSVPHASIRRALVNAGVPPGLIAIWGSMYDGCATRVRTVDGFTEPIYIRSGVRQGCPLSPIIFNLAIDSVVRAAANIENVGYAFHNTRFNILAYADDLALIAETPEGMRRLLDAVEREATAVGLHFNPAKCATLHVAAGRAGRVRPTVFRIEDQPMPALDAGEPYRHLGVPTGFEVDQNPRDILRDAERDIRAVDASLLTPWQRAEVLATFILPRLDFLLRGAAVEKGLLRSVDLQVRRLTKAWLNLPQRASAELVYLPPHRGGCGLLPLADLADVLAVAHAFRLLTAPDPTVKALAWSSLRGVVARRVGHEPSNEETASFLSGSLEGPMRGGGELSLWSRARNAARRQTGAASIVWRWSEATAEMTVECRGLANRTIKIPGAARAQVIHRLRSAIVEHYADRLSRKRDQGKVFEVSSRAPVSNHFMRGGSFTRFADWRFVHRARLNVLPLNGARRWGRESLDDRCRRCGRAAETLPHVICHCGVHTAAIQLRHAAILHRLRKACRVPGDIRVEQRVEGVADEFAELRPDLVVRHEPSQTIIICDVAVAFENRLLALEEARARKITKYAPLADALQAQGYRVAITALVVGALGSWDPRNDAVLRLLHVSNMYASMMRRLIVSDTIRWSRDVYVEHVTGVRQYAAQPRAAEGDDLTSPPRAIRDRWPAPAAANQSGQ